MSTISVYIDSEVAFGQYIERYCIDAIELEYLIVRLVDVSVLGKLVRHSRLHNKMKHMECNVSYSLERFQHHMTSHCLHIFRR